MKKYLLIGLGAVVFLVMAAGTGLGVMAYVKQLNQPASKSDIKQAKKAPSKPSMAKLQFVEIPKFVVTVPAGASADSGSVYLQLSLSFLTENKRAADDFGKLIPIIKSQIISDVMAAGISPASQPIKLKHKIAADSLVLANATVEHSDDTLGKNPFLGAYITTFITQ